MLEKTEEFPQCFFVVVEKMKKLSILLQFKHKLRNRKCVVFILSL